MICAAGARWAVLVGYMRVSTAEQNLALQRDALLAAGVAPERIYDDTCSGAVTNRPGLSRALEVVRDGDALVIWKLDRIGRSLRHVVELVDGLQGGTSASRCSQATSTRPAPQAGWCSASSPPWRSSSAT